MKPKRYKFEGKWYIIGSTRSVGSPDCCDLCHFHEAANPDSDVECPRLNAAYTQQLLCSHLDDLPAEQTTYLIRDTVKGRTEHIARRLG